MDGRNGRKEGRRNCDEGGGDEGVGERWGGRVLGWVMRWEKGVGEVDDVEVSEGRWE